MEDFNKNCLVHFPSKNTYEGRVELLGAEQWKIGRAIQIFVGKENILSEFPIFLTCENLALLFGPVIEL